MARPPGRMASAAEYPYRTAFDELARALRSRRGDRLPDETARRLLEYDHPGHVHLVGLRWDCLRVVYYHCEDRYAIALRFSDDGPADGGAEIASFQEGSGVGTWVDAIPNYWSWLHPRYR